MVSRCIEIANPAKLHVRHDQLVIEPEDGAEATTPVSEVGVLLLANARVNLSHSVLSRIALAGGMVVTCDDAFQPAGMLLPLQSHFIQTERFAAQAILKLPQKKRLWQAVARAKIAAQSALLLELHGADSGLGAMVERVRSGDPENLEAQAARRYWPLLFGPKFRRGSEGPDQNRHLNYGYAVLRAAVARAICAAGLHPSLSIRHHNRYDSFSLASDLMEPWRPVVDRAVFHWITIQGNDPEGPLEQSARRWLLQILVQRFVAQGEQRTLFDIVARDCQAFAACVMGEQEDFSPVYGIVPCKS